MTRNNLYMVLAVCALAQIRTTLLIYSHRFCITDCLLCWLCYSKVPYTQSKCNSHSIHRKHIHAYDEYRLLFWDVNMCLVKKCRRLSKALQLPEDKKEILFPNGSRILFRYCANDVDVEKFQGLTEAEENEMSRLEEKYGDAVWEDKYISLIAE